MNYRNPVMIIAAAIIFFSCTGRQTSPAKNTEICITDSMAGIIAIDTAIVSTVDDELKLSGEINFDDRKVSKVYPFSSGQVLQVNVSVGDKVSKGQTLAVIKSAEVSGNYSDLSTAGNDVVIAKRQMDNAASLFNNGIASEREYVEAKESYQKALTSANKLKNQIQINGGGRTSENGTYVIASPISGYVVEKKINQGGFIRSDANDNLFTVGNISDVWVWANVYETDIAKVKKGYAAKVTTLAYPDSVFTGTVDEISNILDPVTKVMRIRIKLPNENQSLKPEMFANIVITNKEGRKSILVPARAIISEYGKNYVILYKSKCELTVQEVELLKIVGEKAYIKTGLKAGEEVISQNQILLFKALTEK
ncbi:MAG: efflux RND transporter periplasmic adaptor subunit [Ferruginibacter sp.]